MLKWIILNINIMNHFKHNLSFEWGNNISLFLEPGLWAKRGPMKSPLSIWQSVSLTVTFVSLKWLKRFVWNFGKGGKWRSRIFWKKSHFGDNAQNTPKMAFFQFCKKSLIYVFLGYKWCPIILVEIVQKLHVSCKKLSVLARNWSLYFGLIC